MGIKGRKLEISRAVFPDMVGVTIHAALIFLAVRTEAIPMAQDTLVFSSIVL